MPRPRTSTQPLDLTALAIHSRTRQELGATTYAVEMAEAEGVVCRSGKLVNATLWKLTRKGRNLVKNKGVTSWPISS